uniref:G-protein coupled receptors family 1 profile domain-containing protein n=1 Tax=Ciona savignyi TaxID=51511 RepID=H2ZDE5_CIOSA
GSNKCVPEEELCNGYSGCPLGSDERNCTDCHPGNLKCGDVLYLPQSNLYDSDINCSDGSDLCFVEGNLKCFRCLDGSLLISTNQVCDGFIDCYDMSDECLCENQTVCNADLDETRDNITEMLAFVEELTQKPNHENMPVCPYGFDEINCTNRHYCRQGRSVSIEQSRTCDGIVDCDDASDETFALCASRRFYCVNKMPLSVDLKLVENGIKDCTDGSDECPVNSNKSSIFSSQFEMIGNPFLRAFFWIMGFAAIFGNLLVLCYTSRKFATKQHKNKVQKSNDWFIINLSIADLLMGIYLIATGIKGVEFSGRYCYYDLEWRSSQFCNILGVFVLLSSQASVFIMAIMTTFRIMGVVCPIKLRNMKVAVIALPTTLAWVGAISISIMPMLNFQSGYFVSGLWYPNN